MRDPQLQLPASLQTTAAEKEGERAGQAAAARNSAASVMRWAALRARCCVHSSRCAAARQAKGAALPAAPSVSEATQRRLHCRQLVRRGGLCVGVCQIILLRHEHRSPLARIQMIDETPRALCGDRDAVIAVAVTMSKRAPISRHTTGDRLWSSYAPSMGRRAWPCWVRCARASRITRSCSNCCCCGRLVEEAIRLESESFGWSQERQGCERSHRLAPKRQRARMRVCRTIGDSPSPSRWLLFSPSLVESASLEELRRPKALSKC